MVYPFFLIRVGGDKEQTVVTEMPLNANSSTAVEWYSETKQNKTKDTVLDGIYSIVLLSGCSAQAAAEVVDIMQVVGLFWFAV